MLNRFFKLDERNTDIKTEIIAGITTFLSMAYILGVNSTILSQSGMPISGVFFATAISAAIGCIIMGLVANFPIGLSPVMGINAMFTYTIIMEMGNTWECALAAIFLSNLIFLIIAVSGLRERIMNSFPDDLKFGVTAGIGFFLAFIGLRFAGVIVSNS